MGIMLDADVLIANERGKFDLKAWLRTLPPEELELAAITVAELWHGLERATPPHQAARRAFIEAILDVCPMIPYTVETAAVHARLWAQLEASGKRIGYHDLIVAATALERGNAVATFKARHFASVPGLDVLTP